MALSHAVKSKHNTVLFRYAKGIIEFLKKNIVMTVAFSAAALTSIVVPVDKDINQLIDAVKSCPILSSARGKNISLKNYKIDDKGSV